MMFDYTIRAARPGDLENIYRVLSQADRLHCTAHPEIFKEAEDPSGTKEYLLANIRSDEAVIFVAEADGEIIGALLALAVRTRDIPVLVQRTYASVDNIVVADDFRQQGVGEALMENLYLWAKKRGIQQIELTVWAFNQGAQAFYEKLGYKMLSHRMRKELP